MENEDQWNLRQLREQVGQRFGRDQELELWGALQSIISRFHHADFHIQEFEALEDRVSSGKSTLELVKEIFQVRERRISDISVKATAHALAAVHALHSLSDILGSAIMLSLHRGTSWHGYYSQIRLPPEYSSLSTVMSELTTPPSYQYLADLSNRSKHHTVVAPYFQTDLSGVGRHRYDFVGFKHKDREHPPREVKQFLIDEFTRQGSVIFRIGREVNRLTC